MKKRLLSLSMALVLLSLSIIPCALGESTPLFYRVTDEKGHEIYLLGTIHIGNEDMYPLPEEVMKAYEESDVLAVEVDLWWHMENPQQLLSQSQRLVYLQDGDEPVDEELVKKAAGALDMPEGILKTMSYYGIMSLLEEAYMTKAQLSNEYGVDMFFLKKAHQEGKRVDELESLEKQMTLLGSMSENLLRFQIGMYLDFPASAILGNQMILGIWQKGDRAGFIEMLNQEKSVEFVPEELIPEMTAFNQSMYGDRDTGFARQAMTYLEKGEKVFFAVGAAHVAGEGGIADQLEEAGYTVEQVEYQ